MCEKVVEAALKADILSVSASSIYADFPEYFSASGAVPRHITTCLAEMMTAIGGTGAINVAYGDNKDAPNGIVIEPAKMLESTSDFGERLTECDFPGAERAYIKILTKGIKTGTDYQLTRDIGLRIWYILDNTNRSLEGNPYMANQSSLDMDTSADNTILSPSFGGYFKIVRLKADEIRVGEWSHTYLCEYIRVFV